MRRSRTTILASSVASLCQGEEWSRHHQARWHQSGRKRPRTAQVLPAYPLHELFLFFLAHLPEYLGPLLAPPSYLHHVLHKPGRRLNIHFRRTRIRYTLLALRHPLRHLLLTLSSSQQPARTSDHRAIFQLINRLRGNHSLSMNRIFIAFLFHPSLSFVRCHPPSLPSSHSVNLPALVSSIVSTIIFRRCSPFIPQATTNSASSSTVARATQQRANSHEQADTTASQDWRTPQSSSYSTRWHGLVTICQNDSHRTTVICKTRHAAQTSRDLIAHRAPTKGTMSHWVTRRPEAICARWETLENTRCMTCAV